MSSSHAALTDRKEAEERSLGWLVALASIHESA
jgi:hypothetical protein